MKTYGTIFLALFLALCLIPAFAVESDELPTDGWTVTVSSFNDNNGVVLEVPERAIDGDLATHWHSHINPKAPLPHWITVELPAETAVSGYRYYPRPAAGAGTVTSYEIYASNDNVSFEKLASGTWELSADAKTVQFPQAVKAKFFRLQILAASGDYAHAGEIRLLSASGTARAVNGTVRLDTKTTDYLNGDFTVAPETGGKILTAADELGVSGWTFAASTVNENNGRPAEVPERVIDGDTQTHWHSMINPKAELPHWFTVIFPEVQVIGGYRYYPRKDGGAGICTKYEIHVSDNGTDFYKVAEGLWKDDTSAKTVMFPGNIRAKAVKLVMLDAKSGYGSAGEIRVLKPQEKKETLSPAQMEKEINKYRYVQFDGMKVRADRISNLPVANLADNDTTTYWHSEIKEGNLPVELTFSFDYPYTICGLRYVPRQDGNLTGHFKETDLCVSRDGKTFETVDILHYGAVNADTKDVFFNEPVTAKALKLIVVDGQSKYGTCAEIYFIQEAEQYEKDQASGGEIYELTVGKKEIRVTKNGVTDTVTTDAAPYIYEGYTMIPLRGLLEQMDASVEWQEYDQAIRVFTLTDTMDFHIEDPRVQINGTRYNSAVAPQITDNRTFIPLRFVSEHLGYYVYWDGETKTITISSKAQK